nr:PDZ domain-containing protein [Bacillota bacterium]
MRDKGLKISRVVPGGIADQLGIVSGDVVTGMNDTPVQDILDYRFLSTGEYLELYVATADGPYVFEIEKEYDGDLGIEFETPFPGLKKCGNRCLFCFVDQMPPGMRPSLYVKDDDYRLSFW